MGRKSRLKKLRRENREKFEPVSLPTDSDFNPDRLPTCQPTDLMWQDSEGLHTITPGHPPSEEKLAEMTAVYQKNIRNSEIFTLMVKQFGKKKAEEMLKEFKVEIKPW